MRMIYLDNAIEAIASRDETDGTCNVFSGRQVIDILKGLPSAQSEIIRCKDCKYRQTDDCPMCYGEWIEYDDDGYLDDDYIVHDNTKDDGFCDRGEMENDE